MRLHLHLFRSFQHYEVKSAKNGVPSSISFDPVHQFLLFPTRIRWNSVELYMEIAITAKGELIRCSTLWYKILFLGKLFEKKCAANLKAAISSGRGIDHQFRECVRFIILFFRQYCFPNTCQSAEQFQFPHSTFRRFQRSISCHFQTLCLFSFYVEENLVYSNRIHHYRVRLEKDGRGCNENAWSDDVADYVANGSKKAHLVFVDICRRFHFCFRHFSRASANNKNAST